MSMLKRFRSEGGHARGHSRMAHWSPTAEVKRLARKARRRGDRTEAATYGLTATNTPYDPSLGVPLVMTRDEAAQLDINPEIRILAAQAELRRRAAVGVQGTEPGDTT